MSNASAGIFGSLIFPFIIVIVVYAVFLLPIFLVIKKKKPNFWWLVLSIYLEVVFISMFSFYLIFKTHFNDFFILINFLVIVCSCLILLFLPLLFKKYLGKFNNRGETFFVAYFLMFLTAIAQIITVMYLIAWSASQFSRLLE